MSRLEIVSALAGIKAKAPIFTTAGLCLALSLGVALLATNPRGGLAAAAVLALVGSVLLGGVAASRMARVPLKKARALIQYLVDSRFRDRLYVTDADDESGRLQLELNAMADQMEETLARQRQFVGAVSHDIRTPLTIIKGDIEVALMRPRLVQEYVEILKSNLEEVERIQQLQEDLITVARADYGEMGLNIRMVALGSLATEVRESFMDSARRKGLILESYIEGDVQVEGDQAKLRQLLHNLLDNAIHYTPAGGRVELTLVSDRDREEVQFRVKDTGVGISPLDLPHVFEPFYRGSPSRRTRHDGYGLGLAICDHIIRAHGGKVSVESREGPGSGTAFTVRLPFRPRPGLGPQWTAPTWIQLEG